MSELERTRKAKPALWSAVERNAQETVEKLNDDVADIEEEHEDWSPFMTAAEKDHVVIIKMLLASQSDINVGKKKGRTASSFAASPSMKRKTATKCLRVLLEVQKLRLHSGD